MCRTSKVLGECERRDDSGHAEDGQRRSRPSSDGQSVKLLIGKLHDELGVPETGPRVGR